MNGSDNESQEQMTNLRDNPKVQQDVSPPSQGNLNAYIIKEILDVLAFWEFKLTSQVP